MNLVASPLIPKLVSARKTNLVESGTIEYFSHDDSPRYFSSKLEEGLRKSRQGKNAGDLMAAGYYDRTSKVIESRASGFTSKGNRDETSQSNGIQNSSTKVSSQRIDAQSERVHVADSSSSNESSHFSALKFLISISQDSKLQNYPFTAQMKVDESTDYFELTVTQKLADTVKSLGYEHITVYISESYMQKCINSDPDNTDFWSSIASPYLLSMEPSLSFRGWEPDDLPTLMFPVSQSTEHIDNRSVGLYCSPKSVFRDQSESDLHLLSADDFYLCEEGRDIIYDDISSDQSSVRLLHFSWYTKIFCSAFRVRCFVENDIGMKLANPERSLFSFVFWIERRTVDSIAPNSGFMELTNPRSLKCPFYSKNFKVECVESEWLQKNIDPLLIEFQDMSLHEFLSLESMYKLRQLDLVMKPNPTTDSRSVTFTAHKHDQRCQLTANLLMFESKVNDETASQTSVRSTVHSHSIDDDGNQLKKHIMISYAWGPDPHNKWKPLVMRFSDILRNSHHVDVWRDEEGSFVVPKLSSFKSPNEAMAAAVEASDYAIVFVSRHYSGSANCMKELGMIDRKRGSGDIKRIYFVMLEKDYTPHSKPPITGALSAAISDDNYLKLFQDGADIEEQLAKVTKDIAGNIQR